MELKINKSIGKGIIEEEPEEVPEAEEEPHLKRYAKACEILKKNNILVMEYLEDDDEDEPVSFWITPNYNVLRLTTESLRNAVDTTEH